MWRGTDRHTDRHTKNMHVTSLSLAAFPHYCTDLDVTWGE